VVIGAGTAGLITAAGAAAFGARVALIEKHLMGGDCLNYGCVPSKGLIRCATAWAAVRDTGLYGVGMTGKVCVDFGAVMERMRRLRADLSDHDSVGRFTAMGVDVFLGVGRFAGPRTIAAGDVCSRYQFTHAADFLERTVLANALFMGRQKASALTIPWCTYTDPQIAHVGISEAADGSLAVVAATLVGRAAEEASLKTLTATSPQFLFPVQEIG
jgi:pyruvate/2-oxoglutarate dehydrogenase complex dihydrolipoamide dehydrogenase (E3) component